MRFFLSANFLVGSSPSNHNTVSTRNNRLAAIHSFFTYLADIDPRYLAHAESILAVRFKRHAQRAPEYLERHEVSKLFTEIKGETSIALRDDALLRRANFRAGSRAKVGSPHWTISATG